jgi:hypothetical protein
MPVLGDREGTSVACGSSFASELRHRGLAIAHFGPSGLIAFLQLVLSRNKSGRSAPREIDAPAFGKTAGTGRRFVIDDLCGFIQ